MLPTNAAAKSTARVALKKRWPAAIAVSLVLLTVFIIGTYFQQLLLTVLKGDNVWSPFQPQNIIYLNQWSNVAVTIASTLFSLIITFPLVLGVLRWFWRVTAGADDSVGGVFYYFSSAINYKLSLKMFWGYFWRTVVVTVIVFLPYLIVYAATSPQVYELFGTSVPLGVSSLSSIANFLVILGLVGLIAFIIRYYLVFSILFWDETISVHDAFKYSAVVSKGSKSAFFFFLISFIGWFVLSMLAVPLLFTIPYFLASFTVFSRYIINHYQMMQNAVPKGKF